MSSIISANTLFHFTREMKNLLGILEHGIFIRYSLETYGKLLNGDEQLVLPMACFCDIPLTRIQSHVSKYGSYAIGLSKDWGLQNGLSPVLYAHENSETADILNSLRGDYKNIFSSLIDELTGPVQKLEALEDISEKSGKIISKIIIDQFEKQNEFYEKLRHFLKYIKPYDGIGYSNGKEVGDICFYDEQEWRYVPPKSLLDNHHIKDSFLRSYYKDIRKRRYLNMKLAPHIKLTFEPNDIKFIVVKNDSEIPYIIMALRGIFKDRSHKEDIDLLTTRLISVDTIMSDF